MQIVNRIIMQIKKLIMSAIKIILNYVAHYVTIYATNNYKLVVFVEDISYAISL